MAARWFTLLVWTAVAASVVYWGTRIFARPLAVPAQAVVAAASPLPAGDLTKLLGAKPEPVVDAGVPAAPPPSSRFQLIGVVAPRGGKGPGVALIAVDGKPPRAFRIGAAVDGDQVVQSVEQRSVKIGPRGGVATVALELPPLPPAASGSAPGSLASTLPAPAAPVPVPPPAFPRAAPPAAAPLPQQGLFGRPTTPNPPRGFPLPTPGTAPTSPPGTLPFPSLPPNPPGTFPPQNLPSGQTGLQPMAPPPGATPQQ